MINTYVRIPNVLFDGEEYTPINSCGSIPTYTQPVVITIFYSYFK